jgi:hypothetical protein
MFHSNLQYHFHYVCLQAAKSLELGEISGTHGNEYEDGRLPAIALMMEAVSASETSVSFYRATGRNIPEDSQLYTRRRQNLKSHNPVGRLKFFNSIILHHRSVI